LLVDLFQLSDKLSQVNVTYGGAVDEAPCALLPSRAGGKGDNMAKKADPINLQEWALVVVDMQNDFLAAGGYYARRKTFDELVKQGAMRVTTRNRLLNQPSMVPAGGFSYRDASLPPVVNNICTAIARARTQQRPIAFLKAVYSRNYDVHPAFLRREPDRDHYPCKPQSWGAEFIEPLTKLIDSGETNSCELVIEKHTFDGFFQTDLLQFLNEQMVKTAVIVGIETHVCVLTTAQSASLNQLNSVILEDCVWTAQAALGQAALAIFRDAFGDTAQTGELFD
jgi:nicotinamidase-related amidase